MAEEENEAATGFGRARRLMVEEQIAQRGLRDPRLLAVFEKVPRHIFVPDEYRDAAYSDGPLPIGFGQTISQPYIVALMTSLLELTGDERVLEVGTGSGYQAAILSYLAGEVYTIELIPDLMARAATRFRELAIANLHCQVGDGSLGWLAGAPYRGIIVTAAAREIPKSLLGQLTDGGRLVLPVETNHLQVLEVWMRHGSGFARRTIAHVAFVHLRGKYGWSAS
ncbi:MAG TPA: protein-L-isoaspartate(D-aspartate) O-methyltransferase [Anaerolineales bacterium]|nr:protein-L-isoaspartate(D-aspartate) O-methyltransferase [Anaerolineales bacterium]